MSNYYEYEGPGQMGPTAPGMPMHEGMPMHQGMPMQRGYGYWANRYGSRRRMASAARPSRSS